MGTSNRHTFEEGFCCPFLYFSILTLTLSLIESLHLFYYAGDWVEYTGTSSLNLAPRYFC